MKEIHTCGQTDASYLIYPLLTFDINNCKKDTRGLVKNIIILEVLIHNSLFENVFKCTHNIFGKRFFMIEIINGQIFQIN